MVHSLLIVQRPLITNTLFFASSPRPHRLPSLKFLCVPGPANNASFPSLDHIDIVSTKEHSDGSIIFMFGIAREMAKEKIVKEVEEYCIPARNDNASSLSNNFFGVVGDNCVSEGGFSGEYTSISMELDATPEIESKLQSEHSYVAGDGTTSEGILSPTGSMVGGNYSTTEEIPETKSCEAESYDVGKIESSEMIDDAPVSNILEEAIDVDAISSSKVDASLKSAIQLPSTIACIREEDTHTTTLFLSSGSASRAHTSKALAGGEDAYFVTNNNWLGVADGIGSWSHEGINAGLHARELMKNCEIILTGEENDPVKVLQESAAEIETPGSSTTLIAHFDGREKDKDCTPIVGTENFTQFLTREAKHDSVLIKTLNQSHPNIVVFVFGEQINAISVLLQKSTSLSNAKMLIKAKRKGESATNRRKTASESSSKCIFDEGNQQVLRVANIGDTGFIIIRNGIVHKKSSPKVHEFHFPVRIERGIDPSAFLEEYEINLKEGDVVVTATDGLFDNLYEEEIASTVSKSMQASLQPKEIAEILVEGAQKVGESVGGRSPFADAAEAAGYIGCKGGKADSVTVVVSLVVKK